MALSGPASTARCRQRPARWRRGQRLSRPRHRRRPGHRRGGHRRTEVGPLGRYRGAHRQLQRCGQRHALRRLDP
ncbi:MAG: hypothetical protein M0C28_06755 [Candidatus Moduliflexus flocculans]|nr:hypothetical protein [Candidatus Moduliflexus flocculans]